jgi:glutamyl/glutaminyl-tRNA synthetase
MRWMAGQHLRREPVEVLAARWAEVPVVADLELSGDDLLRAAEVFAKRTYLVPDAGPELAAVFSEPELTSEEASGPLRAGDAPLALETLRSAWDGIEWQADPLSVAMREGMKESGLPGKAFFQPTRVALIGSAHGPDIAEIAFALGRHRTAERLDRALVAARKHR